MEKCLIQIYPIELRNFVAILVIFKIVITPSGLEKGEQGGKYTNVDKERYVTAGNE